MDADDPRDILLMNAFAMNAMYRARIASLQEQINNLTWVLRLAEVVPVTPTVQ